MSSFFSLSRPPPAMLFILSIKPPPLLDCSEVSFFFSSEEPPARFLTKSMVMGSVRNCFRELEKDVALVVVWRGLCLCLDAGAGFEGALITNSHLAVLMT